MSRAVLLLACAAAACVTLGWGRTARASHTVCEADPPAVGASDVDISPRLDEALPPVAVALAVNPWGHDVCLLGASDDPSCWPDERLPVRGGHLFFGSSPSFTAVSGASPPAAPSARLYTQRSTALPLSDGHHRRLERPPRAV